MSETDKQVTHYRLPVAGEWIQTDNWIDVTSPYNDRLIARVPLVDAALADDAIKAADAAFQRDDLPLWRRAEILQTAAGILLERQSEFAEIIALESAKPIKQATVEVQRAASTLNFSAAEARKLTGETVPLEASAAGANKVAFVMRVGLGVIGAISPFNFPLNLVAHKLGPALAAGNPVVLKPAHLTPLSAIKLAEVLFEAGLPADWLHVVCGPGSSVGERLVEHPLIAAVTFTGSPPVGWSIRAKVPYKKVNLELGSNAPLIVEEDSNWQEAADKAAIHGFSHAGQSCISTQRILLHENITERFTQRLLEAVAALKVGDPLDPETDVGPLIDSANRERVKGWVDRAVAAGAELLAGGQVNGDGTLAPTVVKDPSFDCELWQEEIFGPVVTLHSYSSFDQAIRLANDSKFGLQAGVYTASITKALEAAKRLHFGGVMINEVPTFRADQQPYGGVKDSGNTREGPAYAIRELSEQRLVVIQG